MVPVDDIAEDGAVDVRCRDQDVGSVRLLGDLEGSDAVREFGQDDVPHCLFKQFVDGLLQIAVDGQINVVSVLRPRIRDLALFSSEVVDADLAIAVLSAQGLFHAGLKAYLADIVARVIDSFVLFHLFGADQADVARKAGHVFAVVVDPLVGVCDADAVQVALRHDRVHGVRPHISGKNRRNVFLKSVQGKAVAGDDRVEKKDALLRCVHLLWNLIAVRQHKDHIFRAALFLLRSERIDERISVDVRQKAQMVKAVIVKFIPGPVPGDPEVVLKVLLVVEQDRERLLDDPVESVVLGRCVSGIVDDRHILGGLRIGDHVSVSVQYPSPFRGDADGSRDALLEGLGEFCAADDLQVVQAADENQRHQDGEQGQKERPAPKIR